MNEEANVLWGFVIGFVLGALILGVCAGGITNTAWQNEAVTKGHAEFYIDPAKDYAREWRWLEPDKGDKP